jgi:acyl transferase domain-containing protein/phosphopantetheinyl transferase (holo-ACP synthase)
MACLFPESPDLATFWKNIVQGSDCLREANKDEWPSPRVYEPFPQWHEHEKFETVYCRRGGFITALAEFDARKFGVMPKAVAGADPDQMLALKIACQAMADAGYADRAFNAEKAEVILGRTSAPGHGSMNSVQYGVTVDQMLDVVAQVRPDWSEDELARFAQELRRSLKPCSAESVPGVMPNILAGRIAGKLGFKGKSLILDAACASSLIAVEMAVDNLRAGRSDLALAGGVFVNSFVAFYQLFCRLGALSHSGQIKPFDQTADGTLLGEGIGMVVLKRFADAVRDGDRIYASIIGVGSSSDGRGTSMLAPAVDGEALALQRAYNDADVSPRTVSLLEAHGTGTVVGDIAEMHAVEKVFGTASQQEDGHNWCALGSVKSMIGHCQAASGVAGLIKTALALHQRVLPPTLNVEQPNQQVDWKNSPCYLNLKARPWIHAKAHPQLKMLDPSVKDSRPPRRAAVSAFGFGGANAHAILEEHDDPHEWERPSLLPQWETEVVCFVDRNRTALAGQLAGVRNQIEKRPAVGLKDLAFSINSQVSKKEANSGQNSKDAKDDELAQPARLAIVCRSTRDLMDKLTQAQEALLSGRPIADAFGVPEIRGIYFDDVPSGETGKTAFILPGLGAAYPGMLSELCLHFPEIRAIFDFVDELAVQSGHSDLPSEKIFPPVDLHGNGNGKFAAQTSASLAAMDAAVVTVLMAEWSLYTLLLNLEIVPDALVGCSTGEFAALTMSGASNILTGSPVFYHLSTSTARSVPQERLATLRSVRVATSYAVIEPYLNKHRQSVYLGADLSPHQLLLSGDKSTIEDLVRELESAGIQADVLPTAIPYHTPLVEGVIDTDRQELQNLEMRAPLIPSWSCSTASFYPADPQALKEIATQLFTKPILMRESIEALYEQGFRNFVEVGPKGALTGVVAEILEEKEHLSVASNRSAGSDIAQLNHMLAALFVRGVSMKLDYLYARRAPKLIDFSQADEVAKKPSGELLDLGYPRIRLLDGWQERTGLNNQLDQRKFTEEGAAAATSHTATGYEEETGAAPRERSVISSYLETVSSFHKQLMAVQEEVMASYLRNASLRRSMTGVVPDEDVLKFPLLQNAMFYQSESNFAAQVTLHPDDHRYLLDHAIGGMVRRVEKKSERVCLVPLTVALEMMAEVAAHFYPGWKVAAVNNVRAYKRIRVGSEGVVLRIVAGASGSGTDNVDASIYWGDERAEKPDGESQPLMECQIAFVKDINCDDAPRFKPPANNWRIPRLPLSSLYGPDAMFHGPRMQSVLSLESISDRDILGTVSGEPPNDWFSESQAIGAGSFLLHPLLLDNATQLVLFHLIEEGEAVNALLPFIIDSIRFYSDLKAVPGPVRVNGRLNAITQRDTNADVHVFDDSGRLLVEFRSISSRRIVLDPHWHEYVMHPDRAILSTPIEARFGGNVQNQPMVIRSLRDDLLPGDEGTLAWCADYVLSPRETQEFELLPNARRKREWLLGRIAAKEAMRDLVKGVAGVELASADVEITADENGKPSCLAAWANSVDNSFKLSISHKNDFAVAVAIKSTAKCDVGVDVEVIAQRQPGFENMILTDSEMQAFSEALSADRDLLLTQLWSVKEAAGKALGMGLSGSAKNLEATACAPGLNEFRVRSLKRAVVEHGAKGSDLKSDNLPETLASVSCHRLNDAILTLAITES